MRTDRRTLLASVAGGSLAAVAGCLGGFAGGGGACSGVEQETVTSLPSPVIGDPGASVTVKAFEDFACPHCATYSLQTLPELRSRFIDPGRIRYEHHDFPLPVDQRWSWAAASAARAVQDTTDDETFFEYAGSLYGNQDRYSMSVVQELAADVGADGCQARVAAKQGTYRPVVEADRQRAIDMGAQGTPAVFVDGRQVQPTVDAITAAVESRL